MKWNTTKLKVSALVTCNVRDQPLAIELSVSCVDDTVYFEFPSPCMPIQHHLGGAADAHTKLAQNPLVMERNLQMLGRVRYKKPTRKALTPNKQLLFENLFNYHAINFIVFKSYSFFFRFCT